jgi:hypothetical protein
MESSVSAAVDAMNELAGQDTEDGMAAQDENGYPFGIQTWTVMENHGAQN